MSDEVIQVHVNTIDLKDSGDGTYEIKTDLVGIKSFRISSIEITNIVYYISANNNTIKFKEGVVGNPTLTTTIAIGNYDINGIIIAIQQSLNFVGSGFTVSYNSITGKISITKSNGMFSIIYSGTTAANVIGLNADTVFDITTTMQNVYNLLPYNCIFLQSTELSSLKSKKNIYYNHLNVDNIIYKIPIKTNILINKSETRSLLKQAINIDKFSFRICDPSGSRVNFVGNNYSFTINFYR